MSASKGHINNEIIDSIKKYDAVMAEDLDDLYDICSYLETNNNLPTKILIMTSCSKIKFDDYIYILLRIQEILFKKKIKLKIEMNVFSFTAKERQEDYNVYYTSRAKKPINIDVIQKDLLEFIDKKEFCDEFEVQIYDCTKKNDYCYVIVEFLNNNLKEV